MDEGQGKTPAEEETWRQWLGRETREAVSSLLRLLGVTVLAIVGALVVALLWFIFTMKSPTPEEMAKRAEFEKLKAEREARDFPPIKLGEPGRELFYELLELEKATTKCGGAHGIDIAPVVKKYIKNEDDMEKIRELFVQNGFRVYGSDKRFMAHYMLSPAQLGRDYTGGIVRLGAEFRIWVNPEAQIHGVMHVCQKNWSYPESRTPANHSEE